MIKTKCQTRALKKGLANQDATLSKMIDYMKSIAADLVLGEGKGFFSDQPHMGQLYLRHESAKLEMIKAVLKHEGVLLTELAQEHPHRSHYKKIWDEMADIVKRNNLTKKTPIELKLL